MNELKKKTSIIKSIEINCPVISFFVIFIVIVFSIIIIGILTYFILTGTIKELILYGCMGISVIFFALLLVNKFYAFVMKIRTIRKATYLPFTKKEIEDFIESGKLTTSADYINLINSMIFYPDSLFDKDNYDYVYLSKNDVDSININLKLFFKFSLNDLKLSDIDNYKKIEKSLYSHFNYVEDLIPFTDIYMNLKKENK